MRCSPCFVTSALPGGSLNPGSVIGSRSIGSGFDAAGTV